MPPANPRIFSDLNALFLLSVGIGYALPWREPDRYRAYMWVMGPGLKGAGAAVFLLDYWLRGSPRSFLLFAASDGALALLTLVALVRTPGRDGHARLAPPGPASLTSTRPSRPSRVQRTLFARRVNQKYSGMPAAMSSRPRPVTRGSR